MNARALTHFALALTMLAACSDADSSGGTGSGAAAPASGGPGSPSSGPGATGGGGPGSGGGGGEGGNACMGGGPPVGPTGATIELNPGDSLGDALAKAKPGDLVKVHGGDYP